MIINEKNFPLYQYLLTNNHPDIKEDEVDFAKKHFQMAQTGDNEAVYGFLEYMLPVAENRYYIPELPKKIAEKTLRSSLTALEALASRGHHGSQCLLNYYKAEASRNAGNNSGVSITQSKPHP